jgi:sulfate transport system substrate-binding protein
VRVDHVGQQEALTGRVLGAQARLRRAERCVREDVAGQRRRLRCFLRRQRHAEQGGRQRAKFVNPDWNSGPTKGLVSESVVVIAVRKGNPKHITGWDDLVKPGVKIVTPDPGSSGSAKWNILAAYTHVLADGGTDAQAQDYLKKFFANVVSKPSSGSNATTTFLNGTGDVLISYENEAISARQKGQSLDYVVPDESVLIENPAAVTKSAPPVAKDFLAFVESEAGQKIFASHGYRPVLTDVQPGTVEGANDPSNPFPQVKHLVTIASLGGWSAVNKKYFGDSGIVPKIEGTSG